MKYVSTLFAAALLLMPHAPAFAASTVYEGFSYPAGSNLPGSMTGGVGWAAPFTSDQPTVPITAPGLSIPSAPPSSGNALGFVTTPQGMSVNRTLAQPFGAADDYWMSFIAHRFDLPSSASVRLGNPGAPSFGFFTGGYGIAPANYAPWPDQSPLQFLMLAHFSAASPGQQRIDLWMNPAPGPLGSPGVTGVFPAQAVGSVNIVLGAFTTFDELRIDRALDNVFVPAPPAFLLLASIAAGASRRRPLRESS